MNEELTKHLVPGHTSCAGCGIPAIVRAVLGESKDPVIVANATGCAEVTTTIYPYTAWNVPYIHNAFENAAATISGVERAYKALLQKNVGADLASAQKRQARGLSLQIPKNINFVVFGGDGGTFDIGLQSLSGALERGHRFLYVCYDNGGYMNTGNQRSSATPFGAFTETTPFGKESFGKMEKRKNIMEIVKAHGVEYLAQANVAFMEDLKKKARRALETKGPSFLLVFQPCTANWKFPTSQYVEVGKLATETNFWPLYEIKSGKYIVNWATEKPKAISEFLKTQGRFKHLFKPENEKVLKEIQKQVDEEWMRLVNLTE